MRIVFDIWFSPKKFDQKYTYEQEKLLDVIFDFVEFRLYLFAREMYEEQQADPAKFVCVIIELKNQRIIFSGYSEELTEKLKNCFTEIDNKILAMRIDEAFQFLN